MMNYRIITRNKISILEYLIIKNQIYKIHIYIQWGKNCSNLLKFVLKMVITRSLLNELSWYLKYNIFSLLTRLYKKLRSKILKRSHLLKIKH